MMPGMAGMFAARAEWEHATVEKPDTFAEFRKLLDARGKAGWEFAGAVEFGGNLQHTQLVFKRPKGGARAGGMAMAMGGMMGPGGPPPMGGFPGFPGAGPMGQAGPAAEMKSFTIKNMTRGDLTTALQKRFGKAAIVVASPAFANSVLVTADPATMKDVQRFIDSLDGPAKSPAGAAPAGSRPPGPGDGRAQVHVIVLKNAEAATLARVLEKVFAKTATITPDPRTNSLIVDATEATMLEVTKLVDRLDGPDDGGRPPGATRPGPSGPQGFGTPMGGGPPPAGRP
jgi:type II secretory pathway component GspD/PulD (secretin)